MRDTNLGQSVLKDVSRSFYLSLRFLPRGFREPASVGYLLARISDTIADTEAVEAAARVELLTVFRELLESEDRWEAFQGRLDAVFASRQAHAGEAALLARAGDCIDWLRRMDAWKQAAVREVTRHITEGQQWDLERFEGEGVVRLEDPSELDRYAYLVAGSVGEFWTELGFGLDPGFASLGRDEMQALGRNFGKGLQLVNILRDVAEDARKGRCYLPGSGTPLEAVAEWVPQARAYLRDGLRYTGAVKGLRLRAGTGLPALLGLRTLDLVDAAATAGCDTRVKVTRPEVRRLAWSALRAALVPGPAAWERFSEVADGGRDRDD